MADALTDDQQLLRQLRRGDEAAFADIYRRHQGQIYRFVLHMSGSTAIADEVTQEVFMLLICKPKGYDAAKGPLSAYLFGIARNLARRAVQRAYIDVPFENAEECDIAQASECSVLETLSRSELLDLLRRSLLGLPDLYREAVVLCDLEEMSYAEAAVVLECSSGTVASRLHRAHAMLKLKLRRVTGSKPCLT
jgi:RNA polymerase sigma-70 factor (ECF subfamily)